MILKINRSLLWIEADFQEIKFVNFYGQNLYTYVVRNKSGTLFDTTIRKSFSKNDVDSKLQSSQSQVEILHFVRFANKLGMRKTVVVS